MARVATVQLSAQPNAGRPRDVEGRNIYLCSPEYMASYARRFINSGVRLVGGCCGTTPEHIRQIKRGGARRCGAGGAAAGRSRSRRTRRRRRRVPPVAARAERSRLAHALARGDVRRQRRAAAAARTSRPTSCSSRRGSCASAASIWSTSRTVRAPSGAHERAVAGGAGQQQAGIETILHYACRDRNLLGMQSDLLGAHAMGLRNLLIVTGDPPRSATIRTRRRCSTSTRSG